MVFLKKKLEKLLKKNKTSKHEEKFDKKEYLKKNLYRLEEKNNILSKENKSKFQYNEDEIIQEEEKQVDDDNNLKIPNNTVEGSLDSSHRFDNYSLHSDFSPPN